MHQDRLFFLVREGVGALVQVAVVTDLMPFADDAFDHLRMQFGREARHEEGAADVVLLERVENARHADGRSVDAGRDERQAIGSALFVHHQRNRLTISVEGQRHRNLLAVGPGKSSHLSSSLRQERAGRSSQESVCCRDRSARRPRRGTGTWPELEFRRASVPNCQARTLMEPIFTRAQSHNSMTHGCRDTETSRRDSVTVLMRKSGTWGTSAQGVSNREVFETGSPLRYRQIRATVAHRDTYGGLLVR